MAGEDGSEEAAIERQLEQQLEEQKESLDAVKQALASDPSNPELHTVHEELLLAIKDAEEGLLHLKRTRLLKEADAIFSSQGPESIVQDVKVEPLDPRQIEPEPLESEKYSIGTKCRFRHTDGRWYNGHIVGFEGANSARISFLTPTSESMLMCKFFLQQRCRFGSNCRLSHGMVLPTSSLKQYVPTIWQQSLVGSSIWAISGGHSGIWRKAELESWDDELALAQVVFQDDGSLAKLGTDALSISEYAAMSDDEDDDLSSGTSEYSEEEEDGENETGHQGLGFLDATTTARGIQTDTALFAKWEHHTRGIASKMMASMGYREGMGLGVSGQGMLDPITVKVLPPQQSLDHAVASNETEENRAGQAKKRSRGGKRKRDKKYAEAVRAAKAEEQESDVFSFINAQLAGQDVANGSRSRHKKGAAEAQIITKKEDRRSLIAYDDEVKELRNRVEKLEEMVNRNRKDKIVYEAALRKLSETRKALADAESAHASASSAVVNKEKEKRWLKF
ncbi:zinc finger CCCH domain-containing protein 18 [Elaeis guineensis]|uniref:Zinc finger CCCH domain-containing protein 18 n=1 Tax=Elaeis guineensis var. tenera TaxID=51953 RepID=A0A6I9QTN6_ELAGV|nr:zinc finger CCCH domain-containing protein 18 [Elaeis guineensis]